MPEIKIRGHTVDVDIRGELEQFEWTRPRWQSDKLLAASPYRYDHSPSFFVNLDGDYAGTWADSGAYDEDWASGNFVKLLAFLRQETYEEAEEYLLSTYGYPQGETLKLRLPTLKLPEPFEPLPESIVTTAYSRYLASRGISEDTQAMYGIGYGRQKGFTALPWRTPDGQLANVMYRATRGKVFFYEKGGMARRKLLYGIDVVRRTGVRVAALCEAPIDALSWTEVGVLGLATGGVILSNEQADLIKRSSIETLILAGDNDKAGEKFNAEVFRKLSGYLRLKRVRYGVYKDMNEYLQNNGGVLPEIGDKVLSFPTMRAYNKDV